LPLLADGDEILCIIGVEISQRLKIESNSKNIVEIGEIK
jgi:hypothetical protein